jgi:hypothetical protein
VLDVFPCEPLEGDVVVRSMRGRHRLGPSRDPASPGLGPLAHDLHTPRTEAPTDPLKHERSGSKPADLPDAKFQCRFAPLLVRWRHRPALPPQNRRLTAPNGNAREHHSTRSTSQ